MAKQFTSYTLKDKFAFNIAILHSSETSINALASKSSVNLAPFLLCISFLIIGFFGICFIIYGHRLSNKIFRNMAKGVTLLLFVAVTGAVSNVIQNSTFDASGDKILSLLIGGAIGGIVAFFGVLVSQEVDKLSRLRLTIVGIACFTVSIFGTFIFMLFILMGQS